MKLDTPNPGPLIDDDKNIVPTWTLFFTNIRMFVVANSQSGTTAQRPTKYLSPGDKYMDTTLGYIVHVRSVNPIVWVNSAGAVV